MRFAKSFAVSVLVFESVSDLGDGMTVKAQLAQALKQRRAVFRHLSSKKRIDVTRASRQSSAPVR